MLRLCLISLILTVALVLGQTNYCQKGLCIRGKHIACENSGTWAASCPTNPAPFLININETLITHISVAHNVRRNRLALGNLPGYGPARRMATVRWVPELARLAALNVRQCVEQRDNCHNTNTFSNSGQNLALITYSGDWTTKPNQELLTQAIHGWWLEYENANMAVINSYPINWTGGAIRNFATMAQQRNYAVGCAAARYVRNSMNHFLLACNYAVDNTPGRAVYVTGVTGAGCQLGTNVNQPGLCKLAETDFDV
ncbi:hypothetical protein KR044_005700 [Drosophila immigrans]|nr:hypothetical protein KR044_005700 [Drosophila immigrans]